MQIAKTEYTVDVRFGIFRRNRISEEDNKVDVVACNLAAKLLFSA